MIGSYWSMETWKKQWFHCLYHLEVKSIVLWRKDQYVPKIVKYTYNFFVAFLLVLVLLCTYFPMQCYYKLDIDRSMRNVDLAWKRQADYALFDKVYRKFLQFCCKHDLFDISSQYFRLYEYRSHKTRSLY